MSPRRTTTAPIYLTPAVLVCLLVVAASLVLLAVNLVSAGARLPRQHDEATTATAGNDYGSGQERESRRPRHNVLCAIETLVLLVLSSWLFWVGCGFGALLCWWDWPRRLGWYDRVVFMALGVITTCVATASAIFGCYW